MSSDCCNRRIQETDLFGLLLIAASTRYLLLPSSVPPSKRTTTVSKIADRQISTSCVSVHLVTLKLFLVFPPKFEPSVI